MFDVLMSSVGAVLTVALIVAGGLAWWGYSFANGNVHDQLAQQKITFPPKGSPALASPEIGPYLNKYAGQPLVTGEQARAYADHFIGVHVKEIAGGKTYAEVSGLALKNPKDTKLQGQAQTLFRGETLRGLLLNAYAFWKVGQLARIGSIAVFAMAAVMLLLTILGFAHAGRVAIQEELFAPPAPVRKRRVTARTA
jgi:hypothetical protein